MRIAHVSDCYLPRLGGIELHIRDLAERQVGAGHDVTVITSTAGQGSEPDEEGCAVIRVGTSGIKPGSIRYRHAGRGRHIAIGERFDVVHVHASSFSPLAFLTARETARRGIPTVLTVHSLWSSATPLFHLADRLTAWGAWPLAWSAVSQAAATPVRQVLRGRAAVSILPNGIDPEFWQVAPVARKPDELRVAVVARLASRKRPLHLADILRQARRRIPAQIKIDVEIVGEGPARARLERYLSRHDMDAWVRLSGRRTRADIRSIFGRSDLFVSAASLESFGIAALEARCAGLPILARSATGTEDFVEHGRNGWLVDSDSAMVDTIVSVASHADLLDDMRQRSPSVPPGLTWAGVLDSCNALYRSAAIRQGCQLATRERSQRPAEAMHET